VEGRAVPGRLTWQVADVVDVRPETPRVRTLRLRLPEPTDHLPGQHLDVRLTAEDGYQAQRSYSIASSPLDLPHVELTVDRLEDGEVSPYLADVLRPGDGLEVRGPIGGYFVWRGEEPAVLVGGGSGVVPLMAMLRHRRRTAPGKAMRLLYSARTMDDVIYADELGEETTVRLSRVEGRITAGTVADVAFPEGPAYVCGSHGFVEAAADHLMAAGYAPERILTERFGPTG
jgi:ferredoxin-NADP reductase